MSASGALRVGEIVRRNARDVGGAPAASLGDAVLSHAALDRASNRAGWALRALGTNLGDRVLCWADTSLEVFPLFVGAAKIGAVFAPINAQFGGDEALPLARLARARLLVADAAHRAAAEAVADAAGCRSVALSGLGEGMRSDDCQELALRESDPHAMFFTSGSTGPPKGVVISHRANVLRSFHGVFRDEPERSVCMFPLFHMAGFTLALSAWQTRGEIALVGSATAPAILGAVERRRANRLYCIPPVWHRILEAESARFDTSSLRAIDTGTSATPIELVRALKERFPRAAARIYYGSTEVGAASALGDADVLRKPGSVGLPAPGVDLELTAEGEIRVQSPYLMDGYFDDPAATAAALRDGWFHTGDLGELDAEGYLCIVGRLKELIRTGGESVAPAEVEALLAQHPAIADVAVVGVPDPRWGEIVCALVVPAPGSAPTLADLQSCCEGRLAPFKKPRRLELVDALPRTAATGQLQRTLLAQQLARSS